MLKLRGLKLSHPRSRRLIRISLLLVMLPITFQTVPIKAVEYPDGRTAFDSPPRLIQATSSYLQPRVSSTYYFTLEVPQNAGESLKAIKVVQRERAETISYQTNATKAFEGSRFAKGSELTLASIGGASTPGQMTVVFRSPIQPGEKVTIALRAKENPSLGGIYHFGVTAFPTGEKGIGQFLGYARLNFYSD